MNGLGLYIKVNRYVAHLLYAWSFSHNTVFPITIYKNKYLIFLNTHSPVFATGAVNSNRNRTKPLDTLILQNRE